MAAKGAAEEAVPSDPTPVRPFDRYLTWSRLARSDDVYLLGDDGFPANVLRFDGVDGTGPRVVNPPMPLFDVGIVAVDGAFLVAGQDCTGAEDPQSGEPQCPGRPVVLRYEIEADTWTVLADDVAAPSARVRTYPGPAGSVVVGAFDRAGRVDLVVVDGQTGKARALPSPGAPEDESSGVHVCAAPGGLVALTAPIVDAPVTGSIGRSLSFDDPEPRWSGPVPLPETTPPEVGASASCTDTGVALVGVAAEGGILQEAPSASFDGSQWTVSAAPDVLSLPAFVGGPEGVVFASALWRHDALGRWFDTRTRLEGAVATVGIDRDTVVVARGRSDEGTQLRLETVDVVRPG